MSKGRLEAFSDGVLAIIITVMVLELPHPEGADLRALVPLVPKLLIYAFSFIFLGIYWNNHHHLLQATQRVSGLVLWANLHLLFWLSLVPWATGWAGDHGMRPIPVSAYGLNLLFAAVAYYILVRALLRSHPADSRLAAAIGNDVKGKVSLLIYIAGIGLSMIHALLGWACYVIVTLIWLVPDRRIERILQD